MESKAIITFNKTGYDPFIDFLKAYSIICVLISHILPPQFLKDILFYVWGDMQVPLFVLIQVFHSYKKAIKPRLNWTNILKRIIIPFVAIQAFLVVRKAITKDGIIWTNFLTSGGYGPDSYYVWIYLQIALILVVIWPWVKKQSIKLLLITFLILSIGIEVLFSMFDCPERLYRLLCVRYLFLIPLGLMWIKKGVQLNRKTVVLPILSIVAVLFFVFTNYDLEPLFFNTDWKTHRWICYFYIPILLTFFLFVVWDKTKRLKIVDKSVKWTATRSYEIFLSQMAVLVCVPYSYISIILKGLVGFFVWTGVVFSLSILGGDNILV